MTLSASADRTSVEPANSHRTPVPRFSLAGAFLKLPPVLLALTVGRLLFVPLIIALLDDSPAIVAAALALFVAVDLYDGVLARQLDADDPARRILDSVVDRLSIWSVYFAATLTGLLPLALFAALLARDLYCGYQCQKMIRARYVVIRADWMYRSLNLMLAGWIIVAPLTALQTRLGLFAGILVFSVVVAVDLKRSVGAVLAMPSSVTSAVIPAGKVRRIRPIATEPSPVVGSLLPSA